jgi:hypothetical protein
MNEAMRRLLENTKGVVDRAHLTQSRLTLSTTPTIGGCCGLFDLCSDQDVLSLSMQAEPFMDWLGWQASDVCFIQKNFITWQRAEDSQGVMTTGFLADPCADSHGAEWGTCDFMLEGFGRLRRHTPTRDITKVGLRLCEMQPRYRLDGSPINDDIEFDIRITTEAIMQDLYRLMITANHTIGTDDGLWDGLQQLINTGYVDTRGVRCCAMDSIVIDWNGNSMCTALTAGHGATWNGAAIANGFDFVDVLLSVYRRIRRRLHMAPALNAPLKVGDMVLVMPMSWAECLLDCFTCWTVCPTSTDLTAVLLSLEGRKYRDSLNGGMFGAGRIYLDGFEIPIMPYDWSMFTGGSRNADAYLLTNQVGGQRLLQGQYNDMKVAASKRPGWYDYTDGGKFLTWANNDETCEERQVEFQPRLLAWAPWAQCRIIDLNCSTPGGPMSADPWNLSFYPECSFHTDVCTELSD